MKNTMRKYGEWALITGASSGIGRAMAERLCSDGVNCILVSNEQERLDEASRTLAARYGVKTITCFCDLSLPDAHETVRARTAGITIDILVNCASFGVLGPFHDTPLATYIDGINVSIVSYVSLTHEFMKGMIERDRGAVILVSSVNAYAPVGFSAVYTAQKAFELFFGEALWQEMRDRKSKVEILTLCACSARTNFQARAGTKTAHWAWEPELVVEAGLKKLGKRPSVSISWRGKLLQHLPRFLSRKMALRFATWAITSTLSKKKIR